MQFLLVQFFIIIIIFGLLESFIQNLFKQVMEVKPIKIIANLSLRMNLSNGYSVGVLEMV